MSQQYVFTMYRMSKSYGTKPILKDINLSFFPGAKIGVVGNNGSGKSTLLKIMAGLDLDFTGHAEPEQGVRVGMVPQEPYLEPGKTVREVVEEAFAKTKALLTEYDEVAGKMGEVLSDDEMEKVMNRMDQLQSAIEAVDGWELDRLVDFAANALVLPPDDMVVDNLSGGERRRVALCRALLEKPDILLLDEPTNHLDAETVQWLEEQLKAYGGTVIVVTHDRYFLDNITKWILELDNTKGIPFEGNYTSWLEQKLSILVQQEKKESDRRKSLERELKWIKMSARDRSEMSRARISEYEQLVAKESAQMNSRGAESTMIEIPPGDRLGDLVFEVKNISKGYDGTPLIKDLSFTIPRGAIIGVVGPNGAGKTTLFNMMLGRETPDSGEIVKGDTVEPTCVDQHRDGLVADNTVWEELSDGQEEIMLGGRMVPSRSYVSRFNFRGSDQQKLVGDLSGGERNRVHLAKLIRRGGNFLMLDEPTNDLDVNALRMLEDAIGSYSGCAMIISHDRFFLDRVCSHLLVFEGEGNVRWFEGNFQEYERWRKKELGSDLYSNRRSRYRKIGL